LVVPMYTTCVLRAPFTLKKKLIIIIIIIIQF